MLAGLAIVALMCWRDVRLRRVAEGGPLAPSDGGTPGRVLVTVGGVLLLIVCSSAALLLGRVGGERGAYHRQYLKEREALAPVLASDPAFAGVELDERSRGGVDLLGEVRSPDDKERLRAAVTRMVGEARAKEMLIGISVAE